KFQEELEICQDLVHGLNYNGFFSSSGMAKAKAITQGVDFLLNPIKKDDLKDFQKHAQALKQSLSLCSSIVPQEQREEAAFFEALRTTINRILYSGKDKKLSLPELNQRINDLLKQSIQADGVINLFSDKQKDFSLFDPQLLDEIGKMPEKNLAIEMLHKLLANEIKVYQKTNLVKSQKFSELMKKVLNAYVNGLITNEEVIQELLKLAEEIKKAHKEGDSLGLSGEELAFYDALTKPKAVKDFYTNEQLVNLTKELTEVLRKNYTIDWQRRESARAAMRVHIKRLLKKYKYPPKDEDEAVNTVLRQCELWADYQEDKEN
ncbi:MAG: DUF3387 domain-containing protein, partial [Allobaculum sp.]|nr:DUF3387 domain-containing protein [Allobaculum sp.]